MNVKGLTAIKQYAKKKYAASKRPRHDIGHMERVRKNALKIVHILHLEKHIDMNLLQSACYLHDIVQSKTCSGTVLSNLYNHAFEKPLIQKYLPEMISQFHLSPEETRIVLHAIANHPYSIPYRILHKKNDLYSKILQDADSLDYVSEVRLKQFCTAHPFASFLAERFVLFVRNNMSFFLNYPQLGEM